MKQGKTILLTGITGNLGALAARRFMEEGHTVAALVRARGSRAQVEKRVVRALAALYPEAPLPPGAEDRLWVVRADMTDADEMSAVRLRRGIDETWHFASSLKFMPRDRDEIYAANLDGLENVLALHRRFASDQARLMYISTAYLAGKGAALVPEERIPFSPDLAFNNEYEKSKLLAENRFLDAVGAGEVDGAVFRPSVVTGTSDTGRLVNYNGYYLGVEAWLRLDAHLQGLGRAGEEVRLWVEPSNTLNLIPLDTVVDVLLGTARTPAAAGGRVFNVANPVEPTLAEVFEVLSRFLAVRPVLCGAGRSSAVRKTVYEKLAGYSLTYTSPYMKQRTRIETGNVAAALGSHPAVTMYPEVLEKLNRHFVERSRGRAAAAV